MIFRTRRDLRARSILADRVDTLLQRVTYKIDWEIRVGPDWIQWTFPDESTGEYQHGRKWRISEFMTDSEIIQTAFAAARMAEEHETREAFKVDGARIFCPHYSIEDMIRFDQHARLDVRETPQDG